MMIQHPTNPQPPMQTALQRLRQAFWQRRFVRALLRTIWLTMLVPTAILFLYQQWGIEVAVWQWLGLMGAVLLASLIWGMRPISIKKMVQRLETQLDFQAQFVTAYEASQVDPHAAENPILQRLYDDMVTVMQRLQRRIRLINVSLWLEIEMLIVVTALFSGLIIVDTVNPRLPDAPAVEMPPMWVEPRAEEVVPPDVQLFPPPFQQPPPLTPAELQRIIQILADAFRDEGMTRAIAEQLDRNQLGAAAAEMRTLADQLDQLASSTQRSIAESMTSAAGEIGAGAPTFTDPLQSGGTALGSGLTPRAGDALEQLADLLEGLEEQLQGGNNGQGEGENPAEAPSGEEGEGAGTGQTETAGEQTEAQAEEEGGQGAGQQGEGEGETAMPESPTEEETPAEGETAEGADSADEPTAGEGEPLEEAKPEENGEPGEDGNGGNQPSEEERLGMEGEPLELELEDSFDLEERVLQPSELGAEAGERSTTDSPFARPLGNSEELGPDSLTYPWDKRDIVRDYFSGGE